MRSSPPTPWVVSGLENLIDAIFQPTEEIRKASHKVAKRFGLFMIEEILSS